MKSNLREIIRNNLIERTTEEKCKKMQDPGYESNVREMLRSFYSSMFKGMEAMQGVKFEESKKEIKEEINKLVDQTYDQMMQNPEMLRQQAHAQAVSVYSSPLGGLQTCLDKIYAFLGELENGDKAIVSIEAANKRHLDNIAITPYLIGGLTEMAEREGLEKALTQEAEYEVLRQRFPTRDDFISFHMKCAKQVKAYFNDVKKAMALAGDKGKQMARGLKPLEQGLMSTMQGVAMEAAHEWADQIYGKTANRR